MNIATLAFVLSASFIIYTYIGYPLIIYTLAKLKKDEEYSPVTPLPSVDIIIAVYNESANIKKKIENLKKLDYPQEKINIWFSSDGSDDDSVSILQSLSNDCNFIHSDERRGKPSALNEVVAASSSKIIIFTDARQMLSENAVSSLVNKVSYDDIGAVSGELVHIDGDSNTAQSIGIYWKYEKLIRKSEAKVHSVPGVTGALYAIKREDFTKIASDALLDDFDVPIAILRKKKKIIFDENAIIYDTLETDLVKERNRKIRTLTGNFQSFSRNLWLFNPIKNSIFFQFMSHKVFRLLVPYALLLCFVAPIFSNNFWIKLSWLVQLGFYSLGLLTYKKLIRKNKLGSFASVFIEMNFAAVIGFANFLNGQVNVKWSK